MRVERCQGVTLPPLGVSRRRPCCHRPLKTWWLPWGHGLSPRGLEPCGSREWWPCLGPWGSRQILSLPFAFFGYVRLLTHRGGLCLLGDDSLLDHLLLTPSRSPPCTRWAPSVCRAGLAGLWGRPWCRTRLACHRCSWSCWGTVPGRSLVLVDGHWSGLHVDGVEPWSWRRWTAGRLFCDLLYFLRRLGGLKWLESLHRQVPCIED